MAKIDDIQDERWQFTPELMKGEGFEVPADYFDQLSDLVLAKVKEVEVQEVAPKRQQTTFDAFLERVVLWLQPRHVIAAIAVMLVLIAFTFLLPAAAEKHDPIALEDLQQEEVVRYIQENLEEFEEDLMLMELEQIEENN